ncbi:hypothetical protein [Dietzia sp. 179-F 9C3 NHS]|uniref:hypothetical protein n=1 Tax=Dietzia sp. 179-F 9C3 NHS TaxID=3374295 RepID=UPI00387A5A35
MTDPAAPEPDARRRAADLARLDAVFGETLPETTSDERGSDGRIGDDWWREQRPPHHD